MQEMARILQSGQSHAAIRSLVLTISELLTRQCLGFSENLESESPEDRVFSSQCEVHIVVISH